MTPFTDEQKVVIARHLDSVRADAVSAVVTRIIAAASQAYFEVHDATDGEAASLVDVIMGALGEAEARQEVEAKS